MRALLSEQYEKLWIARSTRRIPLLVKIAPDLADNDIDAIADLALELGLDGIIATNTTVSRDHLASDPDEVGKGGAAACPAPLSSRAHCRSCNGCTQGSVTDSC